jgi:MFS family permease
MMFRSLRARPHPYLRAALETFSRLSQAQTQPATSALEAPAARAKSSALAQSPPTRFAPGELRGLVAFALAISCVHAVRPTASYRTLELGGTAATVGIIAAAYAALSAIAAVPIGRKVDQLGTAWFFTGGIALAGASSLGAALSTSVTVLAVSQALLGLGQVGAAIAFQTMTANRRHSDRDRGFARLAVAASAGQLVGPALGGALVDLESSRLPAIAVGTSGGFTVAAVIALAALATAVATNRTLAAPRADDEAPLPLTGPSASVMAIARRPGMPSALLVSITILTALDLTIAYLPVLGEARGIAPGVVGALLSVRAGAGLASRLAMPWLLTQFSRRHLLLVAMAASAASMVGIAASSSAWVVGGMIFVVGFALGLGTPMTMAWISAQTPREERGTALAVRMTGNRVGQVAVPIAVGSLATVLGPGAVFATVAGSLAAGSLLVRRSLLS